MAVPAGRVRSVDQGLSQFRLCRPARQSLALILLVAQRDVGDALAELHRHARLEAGRSEELPSMVVIDSHLARGGSRGGVTFHDRGGPYGRTNGAKRVIAVDVTGLPLAGVVVRR